METLSLLPPSMEKYPSEKSLVTELVLLLVLRLESPKKCPSQSQRTSPPPNSTERRSTLLHYIHLPLWIKTIIILTRHRIHIHLFRWKSISNQWKIWNLLPRESFPLIELLRLQGRRARFGYIHIILRQMDSRLEVLTVWCYYILILLVLLLLLNSFLYLLLMKTDSREPSSRRLTDRKKAFIPS